MLTLLEEVVLLAVDEETGSLRSTREFGTAYALTGAVFFDLALARKIDTGTEAIQIIDSTPTGNAILDRVLTAMAQRPDLTTVNQWIETIFERRDDLEKEALASLVRQGILRHEKSKRLWIIDVERFPLVDKRPLHHVEVRLAEAIFTDSIPDTRDIMLVSIAEPCGLLGYVLSDTQIESRRERIDTLCSLETISRSFTDAINALDFKVHREIQKKAVPKRPWKRRIAALSRWLHIYVSMMSFGILLFFAVTGLTLNHQEWFSGQRRTNEYHGSVDLKWVKTGDAKDVAKLEIVEYLRRNHGVKAALADFRIEDQQCEAAFKGPGYEANAFIDRETGSYQMTENRFGFVAIINDLHKARDTGTKWAAAVDVSAVLMIIVSLTGLTLIFFLYKRRLAGLVVLGVGAALFYLVYLILVP